MRTGQAAPQFDEIDSAGYRGYHVFVRINLLFGSSLPKSLDFLEAAAFGLRNAG